MIKIQHLPLIQISSSLDFLKVFKKVVWVSAALEIVMCRLIISNLKVWSQPWPKMWNFFTHMTQKRKVPHPSSKDRCQAKCRNTKVAPNDLQAIWTRHMCDLSPCCIQTQALFPKYLLIIMLLFKIWESLESGTRLVPECQKGRSGCHVFLLPYL